MICKWQKNYVLQEKNTDGCCVRKKIVFSLKRQELILFDKINSQRLNLLTRLKTLETIIRKATKK